MSDSISNGGCCSGSIRPGTYGNAYDVPQITVDKCGRITKVTNVVIAGGGGGSSQWTGTKGDPIYYVPYVGIGSSTTPTSNLQVTGNVYVSNSVTATTLYGNLSYLENNSNYLNLLPDGTFTFPNNQIDVGTNSLTIKTQSPSGFTWDWNDGSGSLSEVNINSGGINFDVATPTLTSRWYFNQDGSTVLPNNLYASNSITTANVHVTDTLDVLGSMTANVSNATFFFDTFTIPYINTQYLNVSSNTTLSGNLIAPTANIATLNVGYLTVNSAVVYGTSTLNVYGTSNLSNTVLDGTLNVTDNVTTTNLFVTNTINVTGNIYISNALTTTNIFASGNVVIGPPPTANRGNLHVEQGDVFIGNSAITNTNFATTGPVNRLIFDNSANTSVIPNKIVLFSNIAAGVYAGFGVGSASGTGVDVTYRTRFNHIFYTGQNATNEVMRINSGSVMGIGTTTPVAKLHVGTTLQSNTQVRIDSSNIALVTSGSGFVGFGTVAPTANLHVVGNVYVSNALQTTNVFANTTTLVGTTGQTTLNVTGNLYVSNAVTTTNITCAGFTSNVSNTIFNFDTLTIPFINSTTLNVASTSNLQIVTLTGSIGQTTLNVTGNLYVSNALTTTNVFASTVSTTNPIPFRNRLINGGMTVWQRNVASISTTTSVYTTADRWCGALGTSGLILSQWPGPIEAPQFPYSLQVTTSTTTSGTPLIEQRIENQNIPDLLNGTPVTVSFWVGQSYGTLMPLTVGLYYATAVNNFGTQTLAVAAAQNTPTLTTANAFYSLSFTLTTSLGATNGLSLRFTTGGASAIGSTFFLTGVQVEKGAVATPFEVRPYATELALAQRYYYQLTSPTAAVQGSAQVYAIFGTATGITTQAFWLPIQFPVTMRTPNYTFSSSAVSNFQLLPTGTTTITSVGVQTDSYTPIGATLNFVGTNITAGGSYIFRTNNLSGSTTAFFGFSCEL